MKIKICFILCVVWLALFNNAAMSDSFDSINASPFSMGSLTTVSDKGLGIHNGDEVPSFSSAPFMAELVVKTDYGLIRCGGVFVKQNYLLTAAHCLFDKNQNAIPFNDVFIYYGGVNIKDVIIRAPLIRYSIFPGYIPISKQKPGGYGDVAVIKLKENASSIIQPLNIMPSKEALYYKYRIKRNLVSVYGWGKKAHDQKFKTEKLQYMRVSIGDYFDISNILRAANIPSTSFNPRIMLGTISNAGQVVGDGDSGGPMTAPCSLGEQCLLGIVRGGAGDAETLSIFTNVALTEKGDPNQENPVAIWIQEDINR